MIYNENYRVKFYRDIRNGISYVYDYIQGLDQKSRAKVYKYIRYLKDRNGHLDEPYSRHIQGKIRELRVDFSKNRYRIFYFVCINRIIILLHVYSKKTDKAPLKEIIVAVNNYNDVINHFEIYED